MDDTSDPLEDKIQQVVDAQQPKRLTQLDYMPGSVKQRHLEAKVIFFGLAAARPDGTTECVAFFATDTNVLSLYNGSSWKSVVLS